MGIIPKRSCKQKAELSHCHMQVLMPVPGLCRPQGRLANPDLVGPPWHWKPKTAVCTGEWTQCTRTRDMCTHVGLQTCTCIYRDVLRHPSETRRHTPIDTQAPMHLVSPLGHQQGRGFAWFVHGRRSKEGLSARAVGCPGGGGVFLA